MAIQDHDFPFPQLSFGVQHFLMLKEKLILLDNEYTPTAFADVSAGKSWHVADFGAYVVFTNGVQVYTFDIVNGFGQRESLPHFSTCCNYNGQLVVGGFLSPWHDAGMGHVGWSKPGEATFVIDQSNLSGIAGMGEGEVLHVKKLGSSVMVYGTQNVWKLPAVVEPVVGFGKAQVTLIPGLASRSSIAGTDDDHVLVDSYGKLWHIQFGQQPKLLGYEEFFRPMLGHEIIGTYHQNDRAFYFTDGELSYRWDENGLSRSWQAITSQWTDYGVALGYFHDVDNAGFELVTDILDFGFRGRKTLTSLEVGGSFDAPVFASVDWRSHNEKFFRTVPWRKLNPDGVVRIQVTAEEFRVKLSSNSQRAELDYVLVKYQITDKRNMRGSTNVDSTNA